MVKPCKN